jgi:hypothetical protein
VPLLYDGPYAVIQRSLRAFKLQIGAKEDQVSTSRLKPCSSSTPTASPPTRRPADAPGCTPPPTRRCRRRTANAGGSASTSHPNPRPQTLEPFFLHSLAGFLNAQRRRPRAATPALKDYSFFLSHRDQEAGGTYVESRPSLRTAPHHPCTY